MRIINLISGFNGVVAGGVATLDIPVGRRYHALKVFLSATVASAPSTDPLLIITQARLLVNGVELRALTPAQILGIANLNARTPDATTGELPFYFSEPWRASILGEEITSWDTNRATGAAVFTLELTFAAGAVNPSAVAEASFDYGRNVDQAGNPALAIIKQTRLTRSNPAGIVDLIDLPQMRPIQRIHLQTSAGSISYLEVWNDTVKVMEGATGRINDFQKDYEMTPSASGFALSAVFDFTQQITDALFVQNKNLDVRPTCSTAGAITAVVEYRENGYV